MKTNNQPKSKNKIFIIWGLFITGVILVLLIFLLLAINKPQPKEETSNQHTLTSKTNPQQEQETYNNIINKIEKEVDKLTQQYPPKTTYQNDGITPRSYEIYDSKGKLIKDTYYKIDGKTIHNIVEHDKDTNIMTKSTYYLDNGKTIDYINEYTPTGIFIKTTYYNPDGTVKEIINR